MRFIVLYAADWPGEEMDVGHGIVDVFAYQEALLIEAAFAIALLVMIWAGFRRWIRHKEEMGRLIAEQTAERSAQYGALIERVEARLNTIERMVTDGDGQAAQGIDAKVRAPYPSRGTTTRSSAIPCCGTAALD